MVRRIPAMIGLLLFRRGDRLQDGDRDGDLNFRLARQVGFNSNCPMNSLLGRIGKFCDDLVTLAVVFRD